jgi:hypothetical protein
VTEPDPDTWQDALNRRLRTFIRTAPLHQLDGSRRHDAIFEGQDLRALALRALDITIERMGLGFGVTQDELRDELRMLIVRSNPAADPGDADLVADAVIEGLLNERERRVAFSEPYMFLEGDIPQRRTLQFHLLKEHPAPDGTAILKATTEAINLYAGMLEYPVEDAQTAENAVLQSQLRRGRIDEAVRTARRARVRSIEFEQKVLANLQRVRRDVHQVDWVRDVLEILEHARAHLEDHMGRERETLASVRGRLEALEVGDAAKLVALKDTIEECYRRHLKLHRRLISANEEYLAEQNRQAFRPRSADPLPDLEADILRPFLSLTIGDLAGHADWLLARLQAPQPPTVVRLEALVDLLLQPTRAVVGPEADLEEAELEDLGAPLRHFTDEEHVAVDELLREYFAELGEGVGTLSEILAYARARGLEGAAIHLLVLQVLVSFDPIRERLFAVEPADGCVADSGYYGDELLLRRSG